MVLIEALEGVEPDVQEGCRVVRNRHGSCELKKVGGGAVHPYVGDVRRLVVLPLSRTVGKLGFQVDVVQNL